MISLSAQHLTAFDKRQHMAQLHRTRKTELCIKPVAPQDLGITASVYKHTPSPQEALHGAVCNSLYTKTWRVYIVNKCGR